MSSTALKMESGFSRSRLHDYQERAVQFIKDTPNCALWVDMGLGKTVSTLTAISDLFDDFKIGRVLIVAPLRVAYTTWPEEITRWEHTQHLKAVVLRGTPKQRTALLGDTSHDIHIINRELLVWLTGYWGANWPYDTVVIDESSGFKSHQAKRFRALRKKLPQIDRMIQLTGTPASNSLMDVWPQVFLLDRGERLGKTITSFRQAYFIQDFNGFSWTLKKGADKKIYKRINDICLTLSADDYLKLPSRIDNIVRVDMPPKARLEYRDLERDFLLELADEEQIEALSAAALTTKLLQFANGAVYTDADKNWQEFHASKLEALGEIIEASGDRPILLAYNYRTDIQRIVDAFPQTVVLEHDTKVIDRWNEGKVPILAAHPASAGHGLNLQHGGEIIVWFGLNWSLEYYQQFNARLHRQGQKRPVVVHHIVTSETIDETVMSALAGKNITQRALLNALKRDISNRERV